MKSRNKIKYNLKRWTLLFRWFIRNKDEYEADDSRWQFEWQKLWWQSWWQFIKQKFLWWCLYRWFILTINNHDNLTQLILRLSLWQLKNMMKKLNPELKVNETVSCLNELIKEFQGEHLQLFWSRQCNYQMSDGLNPFWMLSINSNTELWTAELWTWNSWIWTHKAH